MPVVTEPEWDEYLSHLPNPHILQTSKWGELKSAFGWDAVQVLCQDTGAQILFRKLVPGLTIAYIPKGPLGKDWSELWPEIEEICKKRRAVFLKIEPDFPDSLPEDIKPQLAGFSPSPHTIQPVRTIMIDLSGGEEQLLAGMKQKTRYNIRLASRKGIQITRAQDISIFHKMSIETGSRDSFGVHSQAYFQKAFDLFSSEDNCALLQASYQGTPLAMLMVFSCGKRAWYFYGASSDLERNRMPTYLLQWEAMKWAINKGCTEYDLWGVPDATEEELEAQFNQRSDGLWGVYRFKRGFGGEVTRSVGAFDRVYHPLFYKIYQQLISRR